LQGYGVHDLDLLVEAFGEVDSVAAATEVGFSERRAKDGTPHTVTAEDATRSSSASAARLGQVSLTSTARHARGDLVEVHGAAARCAWTPTRSCGGPGGRGAAVRGPLAASSKDAFAIVARNFHASIRDGAPPEPSLREGLRVQALLDAIHLADDERRWVVPERVDAVS